MALYPDSTSVTPAQDAYGFPAPAGWQVEYITLPAGGSPADPTVDVVGVQLRPPVLDEAGEPTGEYYDPITSGEQMGAYNQALAAWWMRGAMAHLDFLHWLAVGLVGAIDGTIYGGAGGLNFSEKIPFVVALETSTATLYQSIPLGALDNPRNFSKAIAFTPAWLSGSGNPETTMSDGICVGPGMEIEGAETGRRYRIARVTGAPSATSLTVELVGETHADDRKTALTDVWAEISEPVQWWHVQPFRSAGYCVHNLIDWTKSLGASALSWTAVDGDGWHWWCSKHLEATVDLSEYSATCSNTACPFYAASSLTNTWRPNINQIKALRLAWNVVERAYDVGSPWRYYKRALDGVPSIALLAGQREYNLNGLMIPDFEALGNGAFGWLDTTATPYHTLRNLAVAADGEGTLQRGTSYEPEDEAGGVLDDGTDYGAIVRGWPGWRGEAWRAPVGGVRSYGWSEAYAQRVERRTITFRGLALDGSEQSHRDGHTAQLVGSNLILQLSRRAWLTDLPISAQARKIVSANISGDVLTLDFSPSLDTAYYYLGAQTMGAKLYWTGGKTVDPPEWMKNSNYGASNAHSAVGRYDKLRKGCTVRFPDAPGDLADVRLLCLGAQAYGGATCTQEPTVAAGEVQFEFRLAGGFEADSAGALTPEIISFAYASGTLLYSFQTLDVGDFTALDTLYPAHAWRQYLNGAYQVLRVTPSLGASAVTDGLRKAVTQYLLDVAGGADSATAAEDNLEYTLTYRIDGGAQADATVEMYVAHDGTGTPFLALPSMLLPGAIDTGEEIVLEWFNPFTSAWESTGASWEGVDSGTLTEMQLPSTASRWFRGFVKDGLSYITASPDLWGVALRVTYQVDATGGYSIPLSQDAEGLGHPERDGTAYNDFRLDMDRAWLDLEGYQAQQIKAWLAANPTDAYDLTVEIDQRPVIAPAQRKAASGFEATSHLLEVIHTPEGGANATLVEGTDYDVDRANGLLRIDASGWDGSKTHALRVRGDFLNSPPDSVPAEAFVSLRDGIEALEWTSTILSLETAITCAVSLTSAFYPGGIGPAFFPENGTELADPVNPSLPPTTQLGPADPPWSGSSLVLDYDVAGESYTQVTTAQIGGAGGAEMYIYPDGGPEGPWLLYVTYFFQAIGRPTRWQSQWIKSVKANIKINDATHIRNIRTIEGSNSSETNGDIASFSVLGGTLSVNPSTNAASFSPVSGAEISTAGLNRVDEGGDVTYQGTIDITGIFKGAIDYDGTDYFGFAICGPGGFLDAGVTSLANSLFSSFSMGRDESNILEYSWDYETFQFTDISIGSVFIEVDHDAIRAVAPQVVPGGLLPATVEP